MVAVAVVVGVLIQVSEVNDGAAAWGDENAVGLLCSTKGDEISLWIECNIFFEFAIAGDEKDVLGILTAGSSFGIAVDLVEGYVLLARGAAAA